MGATRTAQKAHKTRMSYSTTDFSTWLKSTRKALDLTQLELADRVGCSESAIRMIESGQRRPSRQVAALLAEHLHIPTDKRESFLKWAREPHPPGQTRQESPAEAGSISTNLRQEPTRIIGRHEEVQAIRGRLLQGNVRLITLTGPPGVGKTRLALAVAAELLHNSNTYSDGVFVVGLATITDPELVTPTIAQTLGLRESTESPVDTLKRHLRDRRMLLLLDNFEHVVEAAPLLSELISECPSLTLLVSSREALHLRGEQQFEVFPLPWPDKREMQAVEAMLQYPAVTLFVERAQAVDPSFRLSEANVKAVATLCARVDGLPLAIELVAARVRMLPPGALVQKFGSGEGHAYLHLLSGGPRDLPERQRTLHSALDWSYDLLDDHERTLFARLGAFAGGYTLSSVEAVCNARGDLSVPVLDGLTSLLNKSLLKRHLGEDEEDEPRYSMLETVREYAAERLQAGGEAAKVKGWLVEYYLALAQAAKPHLISIDQKTWLAKLEIEQSNIRVALRSAIDSGRIEIAARIASAIVAYWYVRGNISEGRAWLEEIAARDEIHTLPAMLQAQVTGAAGALASAQADLVRAVELLESSLALSRQAGDKHITSDALRNLGTAEILRGDYARAESLLREVVSLSQEIGERRRVAIALHNLAWIAFFTGDYEHCHALEAEAVPLFSGAGDKWHAGLALALQGLAICRSGQPDRAEQTVEQVFAALQGQEGNNGALGLAITCQAEVARLRGDTGRATRLYRASLREAGNTGSFAPRVLNLLGLGALAATEGEAERATVLFGGLDGLAERLKAMVVTPSARPEYERGVAAAKEALGEAKWAAAWSKGRDMSLDEVVAYALEDPDT